MLDQGNKYALLRNQGGPKLGFIYCGQIPMRVESSVGYFVVNETSGRDELTPFLRRTFRTGDALSPFE
jgi:hypothetical protein